MRWVAVGVGRTRRNGKRGGEVGKGEDDTFGAGRDDVNAVTAVVGKGGAKIVGAVPVKVPRKTVVGAVKERQSWPGR